MKFIIPIDTSPERIDVFLHEKFPKKSRSYWQKKIISGRILVNEKSVSKHYKIKSGDIINIKRELGIKNNENDLPDITIIEETDDYIVIDKTSQILSHKTKHSDKMSVADWAINYTPQIAEVGDDAKTRPGIVHRLDRDVSGVMVIAKTQDSFENLKEQFHNRETKKEYIALAHGLDFEDSDDIDFRLIKNRRTGKISALPKSSESGKDAFTKYIVKKRFTSSTLLSLIPKTGRTHQLRVHLFAKGNPIVGDTLYSSKNFSKKLDKTLGRIFLHAHKLTFKNLNGEKKTYTSPLPKELKQFLKNLKLKQ